MVAWQQQQRWQRRVAVVAHVYASKRGDCCASNALARARLSLGLGGHHTTPPLTACHWLSAGWSQGVSSLSRLTATLPVVHSSVTAVGWPRDHLYVSCGQSFVQVSLPLAGLMSGLMSSEPEMYSEVPYCRHCMHPCMGVVESEESTMGRCRHRRRSRKVHPDF